MANFDRILANMPLQNLLKHVFLLWNSSSDAQSVCLIPQDTGLSVCFFSIVVLYSEIWANMAPRPYVLAAFN